MRILLLSDAGSVHTYKWVKGLAKSGYEIFLFSLSGKRTQQYDEFEKVKLYSYRYNINSNMNGNSLLKLNYLFHLKKIREIIKEFFPDVIHAHYATSYGVLGALSKFHPFIISVWGSDVFSFPWKSFLHKKLLSYNFSKADFILSTSRCMKTEIEKYTQKDVDVIPFGVDTDYFKPGPANKNYSNNEIVIGTVKSLEKIYGIEYLIKAFHVLRNKFPSFPLKLLIIGDGSQKQYLQELSKTLNLTNDITFTGIVTNEKIPHYLNMIDIAVFPSLEESFGVSVIEASACGKPVIASDIGGLPETVKHECTGLLVKPKDIKSIVHALEKLIFDPEKRIKMGKNGRLHVISNYEWGNSILKMIDIYEKSIGILKLNQIQGIP